MGRIELEQEYIENRYYSAYIDKKSLWQRVHERRRARRLARMSHIALKRTLKATGTEMTETKDMAQAFFKLLSSKLDMKNRTTPPTDEEIKLAVEQLKDIGRFSVFATISIIPAGGIGLVSLELLANKLGVKNFSLIPSAFREEFMKKKKKK